MPKSRIYTETRLQKAIIFLIGLLIAVPLLALFWKLSPYEIKYPFSKIVSLIVVTGYMASAFILCNLLIYKETNNQTVSITLSTIFEPSLTSICVSFFIFFMYGCASFCDNIDREVLVLRTNSNVKIIKRSFECGAWDSSSPDYSFHKTTGIIPFVKKIEKFDMYSIDSTEWIKIR